MAGDRNRLRDFFMYELLEEELARDKERAQTLRTAEDEELEDPDNNHNKRQKK